MKKEGDMQVDSPTPLALDNRHRIYMNFAPGVTISQAISCGYPSDMTKMEMRDVRLSCAEHMGRLLRIKEREQLVHGDFRPRHLLFNPARDHMGLTVIDVEHSHISPFGLQKEHSRILSELRATVRTSNLWLGLVNDHFDRGYSEAIEPDARIHDVIDSVRTSLGLPEFTME